MNRVEFIKTMKEKGGYKTQKEAEEALNAFLDSVTEVVSTGNEINFIGWGRFGVKQQGAREGVSPSTGAKYFSPAKTVPTFSFGKNLKASALNVKV